MNDTQQLLRAANLEIRGLSGRFALEENEFVCECSAKDCHELIRMTAEEFDTFVGTANGMPLVVRSHR